MWSCWMQMTSQKAVFVLNFILFVLWLNNLIFQLTSVIHGGSRLFVSTSGSKQGIHLIEGMSRRGWFVSSCIAFLIVPLIHWVALLVFEIQEMWCCGICNEKCPWTGCWQQKELPESIAALSGWFCLRCPQLITSAEIHAIAHYHVISAHLWLLSSAGAVSLTPLSLSSEQGLHPDGAPSRGGAGAAAVDGRDHLQGQVHCSPDQSDLPGEWLRDAWGVLQHGRAEPAPGMGCWSWAEQQEDLGADDLFPLSLSSLNLTPLLNCALCPSALCRKVY